MVLPCLMGVFNTIGGSCFGWLGERISEEAGHLISYGDNLDTLRTQVEDLTDAIKSLEDQIKEAESSRGATLVDAVVDRLLLRMTTLKVEASTIITNEERSLDCTCIIRLRPNIWACYKTSKSAKRAIDEAAALLEKENKLDRVVAVVNRLNCLGVTLNPDFEELESRVLTSNLIVEALKDPNVHKVGVYGMGGTGKTTLAKQIGAELQLDGTFNYVVLATVSEKQSLLQNNYQFDPISIQKQIAGGLKIQLHGETANDRAAELCEHLQKRDKLLIILDDIWSKFELEMVGIPVGNNFKSKILMTSRNKLVLENDMDSTSNFGLDSLPPHDAHKLFDKMIGGDAQYSKWPLIASEVEDLCGGIPILLVTIGRALRNASQSIWEDALTQLKRFDGEDIDEEGYKKIEVSYNFMKNEETKKLFLLCAQLDHRNIKFEDLLKYTLGLDLFKGRKKVKEVSSRLHKYIRDLKGCCLLQDGSEEGVVKMHDVVHKFATFVASRDHNVFSVANDGELEEWPSTEQFAHFSAISFFYCGLPSDHELPVAFDNPKLELFLMLRRKIDAPFQIPDNFFAGMKGLKLVNLTRMSLSSALVSSLSALVKLRTLSLDVCELSDIRVIGELPMLQALSLSGSSIIVVPKEIGKLGSTLKLLDLRACLKLKTIAASVISRLTLLEDLCIGESYKNWKRLESADGKSSVHEMDEAEVASLEEFKNLKNLINLEICIPDYAKMFPKDSIFLKLETFKIFFGNGKRWESHYLLPRTLEFNGSSVVEFDGEGTKVLMTKVESLLLENIVGSVNISEIDSKGFLELKHLKFFYGNGIQYIVNKNYNNCIFPKLETLDLEYLQSLDMICDDRHHPLPMGSFENLRSINVRRCHLLKDLLSSNLARLLLRLEEITVNSSESMESIIVSSRERESEHEEEIQIGFTHQLRLLVLLSLPRLLSFYGLKQIEGAQGGLPSPITPLFNKNIMFPNLETLQLAEMETEKIWDVDHLAITTIGTYWFQNLTCLIITYCHNLSYVFTLSIVKSFARLNSLKVCNCASIEEIVETNKGEIKGEEFLLFPMLKDVELSNLLEFKRFCHANLIGFESLQTLRIKKCPLPKAFVGATESSIFGEKILFPKLEVLELNDMKFEMIWDLNHLATAAEKTCWFQCFEQLKQLQISSCDSIEEVIATMNEEMEEEKLLLFPKLESLVLKDLPKLKRFSRMANLFEWQDVEIENCPMLNGFMGANESSVLHEEIVFPCEPDHLDVVDMDTEAKTLARIGSLTLTKFSNLKQIWSEHSPLKYHVIPEILIVDVCKSLLSIVPPSRPTLKNLKLLVVSKCPMLIKLIASSTIAKSLVNLKGICVLSCDFLEEILGIDNQLDESASNDECIVFEKLELLQLQDLKSLTSFCSTSDCNFSFPSLHRVIVVNCPKMKFFYQGALSTPKLMRVCIDKDEKEGRWEGDLNSTIGQLFEEK